MAAIQPTL